jgi:sulfate/thiosulfate transport system ATP-binding protein
MSITLEKLVKRYDDHIVVNNVSLEVQEGEFFVLLGSSGSGKTTILNLIAGLAPLESGRIVLNGHDVTTLPTQRRRVGFVFQDYALFQYMNVADNVEFASASARSPLPSGAYGGMSCWRSSVWQGWVTECPGSSRVGSNSG